MAPPGWWRTPALLALTGVAGCTVVWLADPTTPGGILPVCPTRALLGIDCPFCGGLRVVYAMLHGDLDGALRYNAFALVLLAVGLWVLAARAREAINGPPGLTRERLARVVPPVYVLAGAWFVVRLLPFAPFTALHV